MDYKKDFPIFQKHKNLVYLDSASTSQKPKQVINSMVQFYAEENANIHRGIYDLSEKSTEIYENRSKEKRSVNYVRSRRISLGKHYLPRITDHSKNSS